jgi:uroporphyrinogen-III decarboxylase
MAAITGRQRALKAFRHDAPDRTPIFEKLIKPPTADALLGHPCAQTNFPYRMSLLERCEWEEIVEGEAQAILAKAESLGMDLIPLGANIGRGFARPKKIGEFTWQTGNTIQRFMPESEVIESRPAPLVASNQCHPSAKVDPETQALNQQKAIEAEWKPPQFSDEAFAVFRRVKELMAQKALFRPAIFSMVYYVGAATLPPFMLEWFHTRPELMRRYYQKQADSAIAHIRKLAELGADIIALGGDFASDHGPMISPKHYEDFIAPALKRQSDVVHELGKFCTNASDGHLWSVLDSFLISAGVDGYEEIDYAAGMDLARLKGRYPRFTFIGNMDIRHIMTRGSIADVKRATVECIKKGWDNGGHILMSSNCIHKDVRPECLFAMYDAHAEYFAYEPPVAVKRWRRQA